jgi:hypothetical protein
MDDYAVVPTREAILEAAIDFGLTDDEIAETIDRVNDALYSVGRDATAPEYVDELTEALARSILSKESRNPSSYVL